MYKAFKMETTLKEKAFPSNGWGDGMTLRDYFAAKVLQSYVKEHLELLRENKYGYTVEDMADRSYVFADAMLKKREL
jgi:hypothetical protein